MLYLATTLMSSLVLLQAESCFSSEEQALSHLVSAARSSAGSEAGGAVIQRGREHCASDIYRAPTPHKIDYGVSLAKNEKLTAIFHTHTIGKKCAVFSEQDVETARRLQVKSYLLCTLSGEVRVFDPQRDRTRREKLKTSFLSKNKPLAKGRRVNLPEELK